MIHEREAERRGALVLLQRGDLARDGRHLVRVLLDVAHSARDLREFGRDVLDSRQDAQRCAELNRSLACLAVGQGGGCAEHGEGGYELHGCTLLPVCVADNRFS